MEFENGKGKKDLLIEERPKIKMERITRTTTG
jgi:hypothetical protein